MHMVPSAEEEEYLGLIKTCHTMKKIKNLGTFLSAIVLFMSIPISLFKLQTKKLFIISWLKGNGSVILYPKNARLYIKLVNCAFIKWMRLFT